MGLRYQVILAALSGMLLAADLSAQGLSDVELKGFGHTGVGVYQPQCWGTARAVIINRSNLDIEPLLTATFDQLPNLQFCKRIWVPAESRTLAWIPVRAPEMGEDMSGLSLDAMLIDDSGATEVRLSQAKGILGARQARFDTALMSDEYDVDDDSDPKAASEALRAVDGLPKTTFHLKPREVPTRASAWEAIEALVLCRYDPQLDLIQTEALRQWVLRGGKLWIMLDEVSPSFCASLIGENWAVSIIDRVSLTDFTIRSNQGEQPVHCDYPVDMVRVVPGPDMEVLHTVRGFPISMRQTIGQGQLLVTTLHGKAWMDHLAQAAPPLRDLRWFTTASTDGKSKRPIEAVRRRQHAEAFTGILQDQIGHTILGREIVLLVLSLFALVLLLGGLFLARRDRLEHLGWLGVVSALLAAAVLITMGRMRQTKTPLTMTEAQLVKFVPGQAFADLIGLVGVYSPGTLETGPDVSSLQGSLGGEAWPDLRAQGSDVVRLIWTDRDQWQIKDLAFHEGAVVTTQINNILPLDTTPAATIRFTKYGVVGQVDLGPLEKIEDPLLVTSGGALYPRFNDSRNQFQSGPNDALDTGEWVTAAILSQVQKSRKSTYERLLADPHLIDQPTLLAWTDVLPTGLWFSEDAVRHELGLLLIPLQIERPVPGASVSLPMAFLRMDNYRGKNVLDANLYDIQKGVGPINRPGAVVLQFAIPIQLMPLELERARFQFEVGAPGWSCDVITYREGQEIVVDSLYSPNGFKTVELSGADLPAVTDSGAIVLGLRIGGSGNTWSLSRVSLDVEGKIVIADDAELE